MNLYFQTQACDWHSDGCMSKIDRKFIHELVDEWLDAFENGKVCRSSDPNDNILEEDHFILAGCLEHNEE